MLSTELQYSSRLSQKGVQMVNIMWNVFIVAYPQAFVEPNKSVELHTNTIYKTTHTSEWNESDKEGQRVGVMAVNLDNTLVFVVFLDDPEMRGNIYRTEDLEAIGTTYKQFSEEQKTVKNETV